MQYAAYKHEPTDEIHILDLAMFTNQQISNEDGATSLACAYTNEDGDLELAVIWSGLASEPGVTYLPLSNDQNREIMSAHIACPMSVPTKGWHDLKAVVGTSGEYQFTMSTTDPDHVLAVVKIIEP